MSGTSIPLVMTAAGPVPTPPATLNNALLALAVQYAPGLTTNLPGLLIEDISSTDTAALVICDQARIEALNSITPFGANLWLLTQLGAVYGVPAGQASNASAYVLFNSVTQGFVIPPGFVVSDGTNQYVVQDGGTIGSGYYSLPLLVIATNPGTFAIPANSITTLISSVPSGISLFVSNPSAGTPPSAPQTPAQYRAAVLQAGLVAAQGTPNYIKTLLGNLPGTVPNLIAMRQIGNNWQVIVGGAADPIQVGNAIFEGLLDTGNLVGSQLAVSSIVVGNPTIINTNLNHGYTTGTVVTITGIVGTVGSALNGVGFSATVTSPTQFTFAINTTGDTYTSGGTLSPNARNASVAINSYPDTYTIPFVIPPVQVVTATITWNTSSLTFVSAIGIAQLAQPAIAAYINSIPIGAPINLLEMYTTFISAIAGLLQEQLITRLVFSVSINGIVTAPGTGTQIISGDPESYFLAAAASITVIQG